jgi:serine/threonine protein kinase
MIDATQPHICRDTGESKLLPVTGAGRELELARLLECLTGRLLSGESIDLDALAAEHPQHADRLAELLPTIRVMAEVGRAAADLPPGQGGLGVSDDDAQTINRTLGDFRIQREIGRGGMGVVYEAEQLSLGRRVALKVLPFASMLDERQLQRFKNEARAAATLNHPNIVPVYAVGCERGVHFYAMQYIEGQTLAAVIEGLKDEVQSTKDESGRLAARREASLGATAGSSSSADLTIDHRPPTTPADTVAAALSTLRTERPKDFYRRIAELGIQAAEALDHAHQMGIVHRDIKPSNLIVECCHVVRSHLAPRDGAFSTPVAGEGRREGAAGILPTPKLYITDFGLARLETNDTLTMTGDLLGTLRYMSPEQAEGKSAILDHRTDIYSLGITLYELLTLRPAFPAIDRQTLLRQIASDEPVPPRKLNPSIPQDLETIVLKAIAKHPADRYTSARNLAEDLHRFLNRQPLKARRPSLAARACRTIKKHRNVAATCILFALILAGVISLDRWRRFEARLTLAQQIQNSITAARTLIEADLLEQAAERIAAADELLHHQDNSDDLLVAVKSVSQEIATRREDEERFSKFLNLTSEAQEKMPYAGSMRGDLVAEKALNLYGILTDSDWLDRLNRSYLSQQRRENVRQVAYTTLVGLADYGVRYYELPSTAAHSLQLLDRAARLQEPTRAFYFVRSECYRRQGNEEAATADLKRCDATPAATAYDDFLPGRTAEVRGNDEEAIRYYEAALRIQPDHYDSLFFLDICLARSGRMAESIRVYSTCIALRPDSILLYRNRACTYCNLGQHAAAAADYAAMIRVARNDAQRVDGINGLAWILATATDDSVRDGQRAISLATEACKITDFSRPNVLSTLAAAYAETGQWDQAIKWSTKAIELTQSVQQERLKQELASYQEKKPWRE